MEFVIYVSGQGWCGTGGCTLIVLAPSDSTFQVIGRATIVQLPIRVLHRIRYGRPDIGVWVQGGGAQPGYEAILSFDGRRYPNNPSVPPARPARGADIGEILIPTTTSGALLYQ